MACHNVDVKNYIHRRVILIKEKKISQMYAANSFVERFFESCAVIKVILLSVKGGRNMEFILYFIVGFVTVTVFYPIFFGK